MEAIGTFCTLEEAPDARALKARPDLSAIYAADFVLPPAFEFIPRLLLLLDDPDLNAEAIADIIRVDAGLTADVLQVANSASYGGSNRTESLTEAFVRLGLQEIYLVVMRIVTSPVFSSHANPAFDRFDLWSHSLASAVSAQTLARHISNEHQELVFTAALLHDIGKVALSQTTGAAYIEILQNCRVANTATWPGERAAFQTDHAQVAAAILKRWRFPENLVAAIACHHDPKSAPTDFQHLAALLYAGNILAYRIGQGNGFPPYAAQPSPAAFGFLDLHPNDLPTYEEECRTLFQREQQRLC